LVFIVFTFISTQAQDSLFYQKESKIFYNNEYQEWSNIYRSYALQILAEHDRSPLITERDSLRNKSFQKLRDTLKAQITQKSECKAELIDSLIEYRLQLWNYRKGGQIPDSTFLILINAYFDIDQKGAIDFCMQNWSVQKSHIMDRVKTQAIPYTRTHPYMSFLFSKLSDTELLELFILKKEPNKEKNELLSRLCFSELVYNKPKVEIQAMQQYVDLFLKINSIKDFNTEFYSHFDKY